MNQGADIVFICVCVVLVAVTLRGVLGSGNAAANPAAVEGFIAAGTPSPVLRTTGPASSGRPTIEIVMSSTCHWCALQVPFYKKLEVQARALRIQVVYVSPEDDTTFAGYLAKSGLDPSLRKDAVLSPQIKGTPTLLLADKEGRIVQSFVGPLSDSQQKKFFSSLH